MLWQHGLKRLIRDKEFVSMKNAFPILAILAVAAVFVGLFLLFNTGGCASRTSTTYPAEEFWAIGGAEDLVVDPSKPIFGNTKKEQPIRLVFKSEETVYFRILNRDGPLLKMTLHNGVYTGMLEKMPNLPVEFAIVPPEPWHTATFIPPDILIVEGGNEWCHIAVSLSAQPGRKTPLFKLSPGTPIHFITGRYREDCERFALPASD